MKNRAQIRTVRFRTDELKMLDNYLDKNPLFENFSSLARFAVIQFIGKEQKITLNKLEFLEQKKPQFLWDYDLTSNDVKTILITKPLSEKAWLIAKILEQAQFEDVFKYLSIGEIKEALPKLRLKPKIKRHWEYAIKRWTNK